MSLTNPFTSTQNLSDETSLRFPQSRPASAVTAPYVPSEVTYTLTSGDISDVLTSLAAVNAYYGLGVNPAGITPTQYTAAVAVYNLFSTLSAGDVTFTVAQLRNIVTTSQMLRSWSGMNINPLTEAQVIAAEAILKTVTITSAGSGYVNGVYTDVAFLTQSGANTDGSGSGLQARGTVTVSSLGIPNSVSITSPGTVTSTTYPSSIAGVSFTGGTGTGAKGTLYFGPYGGLHTVTTVNAGSGYTNGTYTNVTPVIAYGNTAGVGATLTVTVSGNVVSGVAITTAGTGYTNGSYVIAPFTTNQHGGSGAFINVTVSGGIVTAATVNAAGSGYTNGSYVIPPFGGVGGTSARATVVVSGGAVSSVTITTEGVQYPENAVVTFSAASIGGTGTKYVGYGTVTPVSNSGAINSVSITSGGTEYVNGTYTDVTLVGGTGTGAKATITVSGNAVTAVTLTTAGGGYTTGDLLSAATSTIGGEGSGFICTPIVQAAGNYGTISSLSITTGGTEYVDGSYISVPLTGGSGIGATANVTVTSGVVTAATINKAGSSYLSTDVLSISSSDLGYSGSGVTLAITTSIGVTAVVLTTAGTGYLATDSLSVSYTTLALSGIPPVFGITVKSGVTAVTVTSGGFAYALTDVLTVANTDLNSPAGSGFTFSPATFESYAIQVVDEPFPNGATTIVANDGYFIVEEAGTGHWWVSNNQNGLVWSALSQASIESRSDNAVAVSVFTGGNVVVFGTRSMEFWQNQGTTPFPYGRINGTQIDCGIAAKWSLANANGTLAFLGQFFQGQAQVMIIDGYTPKVISTSDIDYIINSFEVINDAFGYSYITGGHVFYQLTFPTGDRSFLYDFTTGIWSELQSGISEVPQRHLTSLGITYNSNAYASDCASGAIYYIDPTCYTDNGSLIQREIDSMHVQLDGNEFGIDEIFASGEVGQGTTPANAIGDSDDPKITLQVSKDYGNTFGMPREASMGATGKYIGPRIIWRRLGSSRDFVFKFKSTSAVPFNFNYMSAVVRSGTEKRGGR